MNLSITFGTFFNSKPGNVYPSDMWVSVEKGKYYNSWTLTDPDKNEKIYIPAIDFTLDLKEVYEKVEF